MIKHEGRGPTGPRREDAERARRHRTTVRLLVVIAALSAMVVAVSLIQGRWPAFG